MTAWRVMASVYRVDSAQRTKPGQDNGAVRWPAMNWQKRHQALQIAYCPAAFERIGNLHSLRWADLQGSTSTS